MKEITRYEFAFQGFKVVGPMVAAIIAVVWTLINTFGALLRFAAENEVICYFIGFAAFTVFIVIASAIIHEGLWQWVNRWPRPEKKRKEKE